MLGIFLVVAAQLACIISVSNSAGTEVPEFLWAWVVSSLVCSLSIYAPIISGHAGVKVLHLCFALLCITNFAFCVTLSKERWLSLEPYLVVVATSFAVDLTV